MFSKIEISELLKNKMFVVVHPLDDSEEEKVDIKKIGPMLLSKGQKFSLVCLRCYMILILGLVIYRVISLF